MNSDKKNKLYDALYGEVFFTDDIYSLLWQPLMQRLRHIRLSNIDSFDMPGIANISRYEHSIGVCFLSTQVSFFKRLSHNDAIAFQAAALLHDWDTTPFGHLIQEAYQYISEEYEHEKELYKILSNPVAEIGGLNRQLLAGRDLGLERWAPKVFNAEWEERLNDISKTVTGDAEFGRFINSDVDLDNLDNVVRIAYHMGLDVDRTLPIKIAQGMDYSKKDHGVVFFSSVVNLLTEWLSIREKVYSHLMPARLDFAAKTMLIHAAIWAFNKNILHKIDLRLTDIDFIQSLLKCKDRKIEDTVERWMAGELWHLSDLFWLKGAPPNFSELLNFNNLISNKLDRECYAYRIKDKRTRQINIITTDGYNLKIGSTSTQWLLGVASPKKKDFTVHENIKIMQEACDFFKTSKIEEKDDNNLTFPFVN